MLETTIKDITRICDNCPNKDSCCEFYTDTALTCTCPECGKYIETWQAPSIVGMGLCTTCALAIRGAIDRLITTLEEVGGSDNV